MENNIPPLLILAFAPKQKESASDSFFNKESPVVKLLQNPDSLRYYGWNMFTRSLPNLKQGDYWELKNGGEKSLRLYADASFVVGGSLSNNFLCWLSKDGEDVYLHPLAVIEFIYEAVALYKVCIENMMIATDKIEFRVVVKGLKNRKIYIKPYEINQWGFTTGSSSDRNFIDDDFSKIIEEQAADREFDPRYVAYKLVAKLFRQFGVAIDIPYTKSDDAGTRLIDIEKIRSVK